MTFDKIAEDGRLWAVRFEGNQDNEFIRTAIKLVSGVYIITGGAIKLTATMQEREHTRRELIKLEKVRNFLLEQNVIDDTGFIDYMSEL